MGRPKGARNTRPSGGERRELVERLRRRAAMGDAMAAAALILAGDPQSQQQGDAHGPTRLP